MLSLVMLLAACDTTTKIPYTLNELPIPPKCVAEPIKDTKDIGGPRIVSEYLVCISGNEKSMRGTMEAHNEAIRNMRK